MGRARSAFGVYDRIAGSGAYPVSRHEDWRFTYIPSVGESDVQTHLDCNRLIATDGSELAGKAWRRGSHLPSGWVQGAVTAIEPWLSMASSDTAAAFIQYQKSAEQEAARILGQVNTCAREQGIQCETVTGDRDRRGGNHRDGEEQPVRFYSLCRPMAAAAWRAFCSVAKRRACSR